VRGDPDDGTKNSEIRRVPIIAEMRELLERNVLVSVLAFKMK